MPVVRDKFSFVLLALLAVAAFNAHAAAMALASWRGGHHLVAHERGHDEAGHRHPAAGASGAVDPHDAFHCASGCTAILAAALRHLHPHAPAQRLRPPLSLPREGRTPPGLLRPPNPSIG